MKQTSKTSNWLGAPILALVAAIVLLAGWSPQAHATIIYNFAPGMGGVTGYYPGPDNGQYNAGAEGFTPNVKGGWSGFLDAYGDGNLYIGNDTRIVLTADSGYAVTLLNFDIGQWDGGAFTDVSVLDHNGNTLATVSQVGTASMPSFGWPTLTDSQLTIVFGNVTEGDSSRINNITFSQAVTTPAAIVGFGLPGNPATINQAAKTITLTLPLGTVVTALAPTYTLTTGTCVPANGSTQNFSSPVTYTVTDGSTVNVYTVTVNLAADTTYTWNNPAGGDWDNSTANWIGNITHSAQAFVNGANAVFDDSGASTTDTTTVNIQPGVGPLSITVNATHDYNFQGSPLLSGSLTNNGNLLLNSSPANLSSIVLQSGSIWFNGADGGLPGWSATGFGIGLTSVSNLTVESGTWLNSYRAKLTGTLTMNGGTYWEYNGYNDGRWQGPIILGATSFFGNAGWYSYQSTLDGEISGPGGLTCQVGYADSATPLILTSSNSYTGPTLVSSGTLVCQNTDSLGNGGALTINDYLINSVAASAKVQLDYTGTHVVPSLTIAGVSKPAGVYGSSLSTAPVWNQDNAHFAGIGTVTVPGTPPVLATFTAAPNPGDAPLTVVFTDTSSSGYGAITNWSWDFGNGVTTNYTSAVATLTDTYVLWGTYPVTLIVTDDTGRSATNYPTSIVVTQPTSLVVSSAGQYQTATVNVGPSDTVTFNAGVDNPAFGGLSGSGSLALTDAGSGCVTLVVGGNGPGSTFSGALTGCGGLTKVGANQFSLASPNNTYLGDTVVNDGTLNLPKYAVTPGLWEGEVISGLADSDPNYLLDATDPIPQTSVQLSDRMAYAYNGWTDGTTWGYTGYFNNPASTDVVFKFGKAFDDGGFIKIDGTEVINDTYWGGFVTADRTLSPGWHTLELRVGQGGGGVGPGGNMKDNGVSVGLGWSTDGGTTWHGFSDPGNGSVLAVEIGGNNILPATTTLRIVSPGVVHLDGTNTVKYLYIDGVGKVAGTWGSATSGAANTDSHLTGNGMLVVSQTAISTTIAVTATITPDGSGNYTIGATTTPATTGLTPKLYKSNDLGLGMAGFTDTGALLTDHHDGTYSFFPPRTPGTGTGGDGTQTFYLVK